jgi:hypothetical protein
METMLLRPEKKSSDALPRLLTLSGKQAMYIVNDAM